MRSDEHAMDLEVLPSANCSKLIEFDPVDMLCVRGRPPRYDTACNVSILLTLLLKIEWFI